MLSDAYMRPFLNFYAWNKGVHDRRERATAWRRFLPGRRSRSSDGDGRERISEC